MKALNLFETLDYKDFLRTKIHENQKRAGYKARLSQAMHAPASFLSQVLHSHVHLSQDHGAKLCRFWSLTTLEQDYFLDLISYARAGSSELKEHLLSKLEQARKASNDLSNRYGQPRIEATESQWLYYSTWHFAATHLLLTVQGFDSPEAIGAQLRLPASQVMQTLTSLQSMGLARKKDGRWIATQKSIHLSKTSPVSALNHWVWRQRAMETLNRQGESDLHYTALYTLNRKDLVEIRKQFLHAIDDSRKTVEGTKTEENLVCVSLDLFEV